MALIINSTEKVTVSTNAKNVNTACRTFIITNASDNAKVYIRDNSTDNVACTPDNGFIILPGQSSACALNASRLSIVSSAECDVYFLYGQED